MTTLYAIVAWFDAHGFNACADAHTWEAAKCAAEQDSTLVWC